MTTKQDVIKTLADGAWELEGALDTPAANDMIFAWPHGLGVKLVKGKAIVVGVLHASPIDASKSGLRFTNGKGEVAEYMLRSRALKDSILQLNEALRDIGGGLTEAFVLGDGAWRVIVDGVIVRAEFNSKGAAEAAIPVERARRARKGAA